MKEPNHPRRIGQILCRIFWRNNEPYLKTAKVTRVTQTTYVIDEETFKGSESPPKWKKTAYAAIKAEYLYLFNRGNHLNTAMGDLVGPKLEDIITALTKLRRLEIKCKRKNVK